MKTAAILLTVALIGCSAGAADGADRRDETGSLAANQQISAADEALARADDALDKAEKILTTKTPGIITQIPGSVVIECKGTTTTDSNYSGAVGNTTVHEPFDMTLMIDNVGRRLFVLLEEEQVFAELCEDCEKEVQDTKVTWQTSSIETDEAGVTTSSVWSGWIDRRSGKGTEDSSWSESRDGQSRAHSSDKKSYACTKVEMPNLDPTKRKF